MKNGTEDGKDQKLKTSIQNVPTLSPKLFTFIEAIMSVVGYNEVSSQIKLI